MEIFFIVLSFILGCVFGSFFNVVGLRIPKEQSILTPSCCPKCQHQLKSYELIPILSFLFQFGKCRSCKTNISPLYPLIEFTTGLLFLFLYLKTGLQFELIITVTFACLLIIILVTDLSYMIIPNNILLFFLPLFLFLRMMLPIEPWYDIFLGSLVGFLMLAFLILLSKGAIGGGDMKLFAVLGILLGTKKIILTFILASLFGALIGILLIALNRLKRKEAIPFAPFIGLGAIISYFYEQELVAFYLTMMF
ncbi:A24 family peptidase [Ornithinibacillus sp. 4-3]|uniref:A24 family peptidase n=1 Tax=Ornithinibacillus sp. 4-3 TaxID=3231488 RepID=A0AB39HI94_9BACI